jgi:hypothetical protein
MDNADGTVTAVRTFTGPEGATPRAALVQGADDPLYGSTVVGGGVPASVAVPQGATGASVTVTITPAGVSTIVNISAKYAGLTKTANLTVIPHVTADNVAIPLAQFRASKKQLSVQARSTSATLKAYVTTTGQLIGLLANNGGAKFSSQFSWPS